MAKRRRKGEKRDVSLFPPPDSVIGQRYYYVTQRPWPSLLFVIPMLLIFEFGVYFRQGAPPGTSSQLVATYLIEWLVSNFGASGFYFPGLLAIAILLAWHIVALHPWKFDVYVLAGMLGESLIWTLPLFVFDRVLHQATLAGTAAGGSAWLDQVIRCFGAGIYEELVFRLICITALSILLIDLCKLPRGGSAVFIILASAVLFAAQHHPPLGADPFDLVKFLFRTAAGLYLAGLFVFRGFGIAAGCHSFYNVIVVTLEAVHD